MPLIRHKKTSFTSSLAADKQKNATVFSPLFQVNNFDAYPIKGNIHKGNMVKNAPPKLAALIPLLILIIALSACQTPGPIFNTDETQPAATLPVTAVAVDTPAPILAPTPTYDPSLPDWTIMLYASADNELAPFAWDDLNEMETAASSERLNILAQVDWPPPEPESGRPGPDTIRYTITHDDTADQLSSTAEPISERNMGDPATLSDFLIWAMDSHPSNRYALIISGYGAGWHGLALDNDVGVPGQSDHLSLLDLDQSLAATLQATGRDRLDLIALNAGMMAQLDVVQVLQPYGRYAVVSPDLTAGAGWDYELLLSQLQANPNTDPATLAGQMVSDYINVQTQLSGNQQATMSAVDLLQLPPLAEAVESLAAALLQQPEQTMDAAGDARRAAQRYGTAVPAHVEPLAAVDLRHAADILAQRSPLESVAVAARAVVLAADQAIIAHDHGNSLPYGRGLALYWPSSAAAHDPAYSQSTTLSNWENFLNAYLNIPPGTVVPKINLINAIAEPASIQQPAFTPAEISGRQISGLTFLATRTREDGSRLVQHYQPLPPPTTAYESGLTLPIWEDGLHELTLSWNTVGTFLQDATGNGTYTIAQTAAPFAPADAPQLIQGQYRLNWQESFQEGTLLFAANSPNPTQLWGARPLTAAAEGATSYALAEIPLSSINAFQPSLYTLQADGQMTAEPGPLLLHTPDQPLTRQQRPLPDGAYQTGLTAVTSSGMATTTWQEATVANANAIPGYSAYFDQQGSFQFLSPTDWQQPGYENGILATSNISNTATLQVRQFSPWTADAVALQNEVLQSFGQVSLLVEEEVTIGGAAAIPARRVAYGYDHPQLGPRTGLFFAFVHNDSGYVLDVDGPQAAEAETVANADTAASSWRFATADLRGQWTRLDLGGFQVPQPLPFGYEVAGEWHRFSRDGQRFLALRPQAATRQAADAARALVQAAGEGTANFNAGEPYPFLLGGRVWQRADFAYRNGDGTDIIGLIMVRTAGDQEFAAWAEAPAAEFAELAEEVFLIAIAGVEEETERLGD